MRKTKARRQPRRVLQKFTRLARVAATKRRFSAGREKAKRASRTRVAAPVFRRFSAIWFRFWKDPIFARFVESGRKFALAAEVMILVTGASGANGTELLKLLSAHGVAARAMVRHPERAGELSMPGIEVVQGDFDKPETVRAALQGVDKAFLLAPSSPNVQEQQTTFVQCARESGVQHLVKLSQLGADANSSQRFLRYHGAVEDAIRASGMAFTFLRPNLFMQTLLSSAPTIKKQNAFYAPMGQGRISVVDVRDIANVAFVALTQDGHAGQIYDITGPQALTHDEMAATISEVVKREIRFVDVPPATMKETLLGIGFPAWQADGLLEEYASWSQSEAAQIASGVQEATGQPPRTFQTFARDYAKSFK